MLVIDNERLCVKGILSASILRERYKCLKHLPSKLYTCFPNVALVTHPLPRSYARDIILRQIHSREAQSFIISTSLHQLKVQIVKARLFTPSRQIVLICWKHMHKERQIAVICAAGFPRIYQPAIINVENYMDATGQLAQTTLRSVLGQHELDELLAERERLNRDIQAILDQQTDQWGIKVSNVEIKHVDIDESMVRAIAKQAEAERERRAKIIHADGEQQAATKLVEAARELRHEGGAMQLRYLQTLTEIAGDKSSTIVFPLPVSILEGLQGMASGPPPKGS